MTAMAQNLTPADMQNIALYLARLKQPRHGWPGEAG